jgi:hypothetical protein
VTTWERITFKLVEDGRRKTVILRNPVPVTLGGGSCVSGIEVDAEDQEVAPAGVDERRRIISLDLVTKRTAMRQNLTYGTLERADRPKDPASRYVAEPGEVGPVSGMREHVCGLSGLGFDCPACAAVRETADAVRD